MSTTTETCDVKGCGRQLQTLVKTRADGRRFETSGCPLHWRESKKERAAARKAKGAPAAAGDANAAAAGDRKGKAKKS